MPHAATVCQESSASKPTFSFFSSIANLPKWRHEDPFLNWPFMRSNLIGGCARYNKLYLARPLNVLAEFPFHIPHSFHTFHFPSLLTRERYSLVQIDNVHLTQYPSHVHITRFLRQLGGYHSWIIPHRLMKMPSF